MSRTVAVIWHASFCLAAGVLYFLFVLPRWWELSGDTSHTLGTVLRIVAGALIGLAALPVVFTLLRTRRPELGTPQLALTLRTWAIVLHVLAGLLLIGPAISEIWLSLDDAGQWLFGIYGAAAAIALLGALTFYLAFAAELPPPPPKPLKPKKQKRGRGRRKAAGTAQADDATDATDATDADSEVETTEVETTEADTTEADDQPAEVTAAGEEPTSEAPTADESTPDEPTPDEPAAGVPTRRRRRRLRGGVAVED